MAERKREGHVLLVALLATLLLRLLALGADVEVSAHAARLNQTIPTRTPTGQAPPTQPPPGPTSPPATASPSATSGGPTATWTATAAPSTATGSPSGSPPPTATLSPASASPTSAPVEAEGTEGALTPQSSLTPTPGQVPAAPSGTLAVPTTAGSPATRGTPTGEGVATGPALAPTAEGRAPTPWDTPCLWILGGLALMAAGLAILLRQRGARSRLGPSSRQGQGDGDD
jgi:hypothetical protein